MSNNLEQSKVLNPTIWRHLTNFWTLVIYALTIWDFFKHNEYSEYMGPVATIYIALLTIYTAEKEFERWHDYHTGRHPGEMYVIVWTILILGLIIPQFIYHTGYKIPDPVFSAYIVVIGILAITKKSKAIYRKRKKKI